MKINFLKSVLRNKWRCGVAPLAMLFATCFAFTPSAAQSKNQKRITSIQIREVSEGSRVTIGSDSALSDYEAFRRGERFYVRIPLADFTAGKPAFRGDGFEDVQVQKVGDSVVVSFKLQPGASARVDQRLNRLDVIFTGPNRIARSNRATAESNRATYIPIDGIVRARNPKILQRRDGDAAGPIPPGSPRVTRERVVTGRANEFQTPNSQGATNPRAYSNKRGGNRPAKNISASGSESSSGVSKRETSSSVSRAAPSVNTSKSESSPTVIPSTAASPGYPAATSSSTPAVPVASQPGVKSPGLGVSQNGKRWSDIARQWVSANRQASLLAALVLLCVLVFLAALLFRRRKNGVKSNRSEATLAQPKSATDALSNSPSAVVPVNSSTSSNGSSEVVNQQNETSEQNEPTPTTPPKVAANAQETNHAQENAARGKLMPEQAMARTAVAAPQNQAWVPTNRSTRSSADADQEREVFEL